MRPSAFNYIRGSSDDQMKYGATPGAQEDICRAWAEKNGYEYRGPYLEQKGVHGDSKIDQREAIINLLVDIRRGDVLLVQKRDRIARDRYQVLVLEHLLKSRGARLVSAMGEGTDTDDPNDIGALVLRTITDLFAEVELMNIRIRTKMGLARKKREMSRTGAVPYGFKIDASDPRRSRPRRNGQGNLPVGLVLDKEEQKILAVIGELRQQGLGYQRTALELTARGIPTKSGKPWSRGTIQGIVERSRGPASTVVS